jgi:hypothetical protein
MSESGGGFGSGVGSVLLFVVALAIPWPLLIFGGVVVALTLVPGLWRDRKKKVQRKVNADYRFRKWKESCLEPAVE